MDIFYFQRIRPFRLGGGAIMGIFYFQGVRPFRFAGKKTIMDILYFQGVRPFRFGGELSWTSFTSKGYDPFGGGNYH